MEITLQQDNFVKAYILNGGNATDAAIKANYATKSARTTACRLLTKENIQQAISQHRQVSMNDFIYKKHNKLLLLQDVMTRCIKPDEEKGVINSAAVIGAIKEHNALMGDYDKDTGNDIDQISEIKITVVGGKDNQ